MLINSKISALWRDVARKVRQVGLVGTIQHTSAKLLRESRGLVSPRTRKSDPFDLQYGTDTARIVSVGALDVSEEHFQHATRYEAVVPEAFFSMMKELPIAHEQFVFVDLGSGKGRALLLASRFPFKQIVGVEVSQNLTGIARKNIQLFTDERQRCHEIHTVCQDALDYQLPRQDLVVYLYNPFDAHFMERMLNSIEKSVHDFPRKVYVVYHWPLHGNVWDRSINFQAIKSTPIYALYQTKFSTSPNSPQLSNAYQGSAK